MQLMQELQNLIVLTRETKHLSVTMEILIQITRNVWRLWEASIFKASTIFLGFYLPIARFEVTNKKSLKW